MNFNDYIEIDIDDIETFVNDPDFHRYLIENNTDFATAAFVLQTLLNAVKELRSQSQVEEDWLLNNNMIKSI